MSIGKAFFLFIITITSVSFCYGHDQDYVEWLKEHSLLQESRILSEDYSGEAIQWKHPCGHPEPRKKLRMGSVWFTSYEFSTIPLPGKNVLQTLGSEEVWRLFKDIGIDGMHTAPLKLAGGVDGKKFTPSVDGGYDPIGSKIDPQFGTIEDYQKMVATAKKYNGYILGNLIPGHTGMGPDFHLALMNYTSYPGIYHMVEIKPEDWDLLPDVSDEKISANLMPMNVETLKKKGYIVGSLQNVIFYAPGVKDTNWSASKPITGVDGKVRRWVYLHYFKAEQPSLNWLDPTFGANRIMAGLAMNSIRTMQNTAVRFDAVPFMGVEKRSGNRKAFSEAHPLSIVCLNQLSMFVRKLGGFSFQELNMSLDDIKKYSELGPEFAYDFVTRAAYLHAIIQQDASLLRLMYELLEEHELDPGTLVHALQNHDEFNFDLVHFTSHPQEKFLINGKKVRGEAIHRMIQKKDYPLLWGENAPYNLPFPTGCCTTTVGLCAAAFGIKDVFSMTDEEKEKVKSAHLLLTFFNAMQPGIFALSGWDLVGAYPLPLNSVKEMIQRDDNDNRWINRGSYDLLGKNPSAKKSPYGIPKAKTLYGSLPYQLKDPTSYVSQLRKLLRVRKLYKIPYARFYRMVKFTHPSIFGVLYQLPSTEHLVLTVMNFSDQPVKEKISLPQIYRTNAINIVENQSEKKDVSSKRFDVVLDSYEGKAILFRPNRDIFSYKVNSNEEK